MSDAPVVPPVVSSDVAQDGSPDGLPDAPLGVPPSFVPGETNPSLGVELEMATAHADSGNSHPVQEFFQSLQAIWSARNVPTRLLVSGQRAYGLKSPRGLHSLDNGFNNLESSLGPISGSPRALDDLAAMIRAELADVDRALAREGAMIVNFSEHPDVLVDRAFYFAVRAPKSIYDYQITHRGWNHMSGFDAKAQNSPCTGMALDQAVPALNCLLALAPAFIALYANSPFEAGRITGCKENRLTLWQRQMDCATMAGDRKLHRAPARPFRHLADYLTWMFGPGTQMWFADMAGMGKNPREMHLIPGTPSLLEFLHGPPRTAFQVQGGAKIRITPRMSDLAAHQFAQYSDCRLRYELVGDGPDLRAFLAVLDEQPERLEEFLIPHLAYCYLEGRAAGANFADRHLRDLDRSEPAASVAVSPSALQYGLLRNLDRTRRLVAGYAWSDLLGLREETVRSALDATYRGISARKLCAQVLDIAGEGLGAEQAWMLAYPQWVLQTGKTGADRALERYAQLTGSAGQRLRRLVLERRMLPV